MDTICYHDTQDVDIFQLALLMETVGWHDRARDVGRLAKLVSGSMLVASAWHSDRLVGFARAISDGERDAYITDVAVLQKYRRQRVGRELLLRLVRGRDHISFILQSAPELEGDSEAVGFRAAHDLRRRPSVL